MVHIAVRAFYRRCVKVRNEERNPAALIIWVLCGDSKKFGSRVVHVTSCCHFILRWNFWMLIGHVVLFLEAIHPLFCPLFVIFMAGCVHVELVLLISCSPCPCNVVT